MMEARRRLMALQAAETFPVSGCIQCYGLGNVYSVYCNGVCVGSCDGSPTYVQFTFSAKIGDTILIDSSTSTKSFLATIDGIYVGEGKTITYNIENVITNVSVYDKRVAL